MTLQEKHIHFLDMLAREANNENTTQLKIDSNPTSDIIQNDNINENTETAEPQETEELLAKGAISKSLYWKYFRSGTSVFTIIILLCLSIMGQIGSSGSDYWVGYW